MPLYGLTADDLREYALAGSPPVDLSAYTDEECLRLLTTANRFINANDDQLIGSRTDRDQPDAYPRRNLRINGFDYLDDEIPSVVKECVPEQFLYIYNIHKLFCIIVYGCVEQSKLHFFRNRLIVVFGNF